MRKIKRALSEVGIPENYDEMFNEMEKNDELKALAQNMQQLNIFCGYTGSLFLTLGIVAHFAYDHKVSLEYLGLFSVLHILSAFSVVIAFQKKNRYLLLIAASLNATWLALVSLLIIVLIWLIKNKEIQEEFNNEMVFHIGLVFYYPLSIVCAVLNLMLFSRLLSPANRERNSKLKSGSFSSIKIRGQL